MSTISVNDLEAMDRLDLIPPEILSWINAKKGKDPLQSAHLLFTRRMKRRFLRTIFGPILFFSLGACLGSVLVFSVYGAQPVSVLADFTSALGIPILFSGVFFGAGCIPFPSDGELEDAATSLGHAYGLLRKRLEVSFFQLRMMGPDMRTQMANNTLVKLAGEVLRCEEHEIEISRDTTSPGPQSRALATNDVQAARDRLHELHKVAQELGVIPSTSVKVYFDQAKEAIKIAG